MNTLYILCGIPFSGKTTLANELVAQLRFEKIDLDDIKFELYGSSVTDGQLTQKDWDIIYQRIENYLREGKTVVHDTGNFTFYERNIIREIAIKLGISPITIYLDIPTHLAKARLMKNRVTSIRFDVRDEDFEAAVKEMEVPGGEEHAIIYHAWEDMNVWIKKYII